MSVLSRLNKLEKVVDQLTKGETKTDVYTTTEGYNNPVYLYSFPSEKAGIWTILGGSGHLPPNVIAILEASNTSNLQSHTTS